MSNSSYTTPIRKKRSQTSVLGGATCRHSAEEVKRFEALELINAKERILDSYTKEVKCKPPRMYIVDPLFWSILDLDLIDRLSSGETYKVGAVIFDNAPIPLPEKDCPEEVKVWDVASNNYLTLYPESIEGVFVNYGVMVSDVPTKWYLRGDGVIINIQDRKIVG